MVERSAKKIARYRGIETSWLTRLLALIKFMPGVPPLEIGPQGALLSADATHGLNRDCDLIAASTAKQQQRHGCHRFGQSSRL
jgi:hypothetical protein